MQRNRNQPPRDSPASVLRVPCRRPSRSSRSSRSSEWTRLACLVALAALCAAPTCAPSLVPVFDYSVPPRFQVPALPSPQDPSPTEDRYFQGPVLPASWHVDLDGCASAGPIARYTWTVDGQQVASSTSCSGASFDAPEEGTYQVTLTVEDTGGASSSTTQPVVVQDWLVFGLGDSYGSGEGNPEVPIPSAQVSAVAAARNAYDAAAAAATQAIADELLAQQNLDALLPLLADVRADYQAWLAAVAARNSACSNIPPTPLLCAQAQAAATVAAANLTASLTALGLESLFGSSTLLGVLQNLEDSARQALSLAAAARQAAESALAAADAALQQEYAQLGPLWLSRQCHRSSFSGQVQAARQLEEDDPHTSVTFVHLACSGATIPQGLTGGYGGQEPGSNATLPAQLNAAAALAAGREIDALVVSIGGNDVHFADVIGECVTTEPCFAAAAALDPAFASFVSDTCDPLWPLDGFCANAFSWLRSRSQSLAGNADQTFQGGLVDLAGRYDTVAQRLAALGWSTGKAPLYLTAYPRITTRFARDGSGQIELCGWDPTAPKAEQEQNLPGVTLPEILWADTAVAPVLADAMQASAAAHGWHFVDGHVSLFDGHGYCADANWLVRIQQSVRAQLRPSVPAASIAGAVHPNALGHQAYTAAILGSLRCDLYPGCNPAALPRGPRDSDGDGIPDERDLCVDAADASQRDTDGDGHGNRCDPDLDQSGLVDAADVALMKGVFFSADPDADLNGDGVVDFLDLGILNSLLGGPPGPSGTL